MLLFTFVRLGLIPITTYNYPWALQSAGNSRLDECACLAVKNIGKSRHGGRKPHARFDEGGLLSTLLLTPRKPLQWFCRNASVHISTRKRVPHNRPGGDHDVALHARPG